MSTILNGRIPLVQANKIGILCRRPPFPFKQKKLKRLLSIYSVISKRGIVQCALTLGEF